MLQPALPVWALSINMLFYPPAFTADCQDQARSGFALQELYVMSSQNHFMFLLRESCQETFSFCYSCGKKRPKQAQYNWSQGHGCQDLLLKPNTSNGAHVNFPIICTRDIRDSEAGRRLTCHFLQPSSQMKSLIGSWVRNTKNLGYWWWSLQEMDHAPT